MDSTFIAACQGLGLALAAGLVAAAPGRLEGYGAVLAALGATAGAILFTVSLSSNDHASWPGVPLGAIAALLAFAAIAGVVAGAARRSEGASPAVIGSMVGLFALVLAGLSLVVSPVALVVLAGLVLLLASRRGRARRKYEGLRVLR